MKRFVVQLLGEVELTDERWRHITAYHPDAERHKGRIFEVLTAPDTIRRSTYDQDVLLFYRRFRGKKYLAVVVKTNKRKFILTAYFTDRIQHQPL